MKKREDYAARLKELVNQLAEEGTVVEVDSDLVDDVGLSSIEIMELIEQLEDTYDISFPLNDLAEIRTITDMVKELERLVEQAMNLIERRIAAEMLPWQDSNVLGTLVLSTAARRGRRRRTQRSCSPAPTTISG